MPGKRTSIKNNYRKPLGKRLIGFFTSRSLWLSVILATITGLLVWNWQDITKIISNFSTTIWQLSGYGLIIILFALAVIVLVLAARRPGSPLRHVLRLLGILSFVAGIWGILGWIGYGGDIGSAITGSNDTIGVLRITGLMLLGIILFAPGVLGSLGAAFGNSPKSFKITVLVLVITGATVGIVFWQRDTLNSLAGDIINWIWSVFGWGLVLVGLGIIISVAALGKRQISQFIETTKAHHVNRWVGGGILLFAIWGFLAFFELGGEIGNFITGEPPLSFSGVLRILGISVLGIIFILPGTLRSLFGLFGKKEPIIFPVPEAKQEPRALGGEARTRSFYPLFRRNAPISGAPARRTPNQPVQPELPITMPKTVMPVQEALKSVEEKTAQPPSQPSDLKQVAQEVWKKYGENADVTVEDGWKLPPVDILDKIAELEFSEADNLGRARMIEDALTSYGVDAKVVQINVGPTVTQFGIEPGWDRRLKEVKEKDKDGSTITRTEEVSRTRVKVDRITSLANDLALALAASSIRIEAPVPGKAVVGIEVPNTVFGVVSLRSVIESSSFQKLKVKSRLALALGKGAGGEAISADLSKMPHLLIAGATGSGKTVCLNSVICCLLIHNTPEDVRFIMIDPKRVELTQYNGIPHMATPVIVDTEKALGTLRWLSQEMDNRYKKMALAGVRNIEGYNKSRTGKEKLPFLVLVIDELADLMMTGAEECEHILCRLAQLARATGIHLVVATQRPSVDVVTGLIKANFPTRISFAVTSQVDSRTILDTVGAEKLLGRGDMLYMPTDAAKPKRLQGCFVADAETERLVYFWGKQASQETIPLDVEEIVASEAGKRRTLPTDPLLASARKLAEEHGSISASYLQRQLRIGYNRAAKLMEELEAEGTAGDVKDTGVPTDPNRDGGAEVPKN